MNPDEGSPDIVVIGASAGGVAALQKLFSGVPAQLEAAVFVALHLWPESESLLPQILSRAGALHAAHPADRDPVETGRIYVAPPDRHLLLHNGFLRVTCGPMENLHRPSIDVLFRSAAMAYGPSVIGVLLTGADDDGAAGLKMIKDRGGIAIIQDPNDSLHPEMPQQALRILEPDYMLPVAAIGPLLGKLVHGSVKRRPMRENTDNLLSSEEGLPVDDKSLGTPTAYSCPECNGTLWELREGKLLRYRCRVGHAFSAASMVVAEDGAVERSLWEAVRVLEESASMLRRIADKSEVLHQRLTVKADERQRHAQVIRDLLLKTAA